jgi:hypothetical protein
LWAMIALMACRLAQPSDLSNTHLAYVLTSRFPAARLGFMQGALGVLACLSAMSG